MTTYEHASSKLGNVKPETRSIAREIFDAAQRAGHEIWFMWGMGTGTEHGSGLALDLMVRNERAGDWIRDYIWANRGRLRLRHVIWEQHITSTVTRPGERRLMANRGSVTENHYDHNHVWFFSGPYVPPSGQPSQPPATGTKSVTELAHEVLAGKWGNDPDRSNSLRSKGYDPVAVQAEVNRLYRPSVPPPPPRKTVAQMAAEVLAGKWGNGADRVGRLTDAGYNAAEVQAEVNRQLRSNRKTVAQLAQEVIDGKWNDNPERARLLTAAGYDANAVQAEVNRRFR